MRKTIARLLAQATSLLFVVAVASADTTPRHIADLGRGGFLVTPTGSPPEMTSIAGSRFLELVPDSQREVCRIILEYSARTIRGLYQLRIVDARGREIMVCSL